MATEATFVESLTIAETLVLAEEYRKLAEVMPGAEHFVGQSVLETQAHFGRVDQEQAVAIVAAVEQSLARQRGAGHAYASQELPLFSIKGRGQPAVVGARVRTAFSGFYKAHERSMAGGNALGRL